MIKLVIVEGKKKKKKSRCERIGSRKYHTKTGLWKNMAISQCKKGKIWKGIKSEGLEENNMKITKEYLKQVIKEEIENIEEGSYSNVPSNLSGLQGYMSDLGKQHLEKYYTNAVESVKNREGRYRPLTSEEVFAIVSRVIQLLANAEQRPPPAPKQNPKADFSSI